MERSGALVSMQGVAVTYPARNGNPPLTVVTDVSLVVRPGSVICIAGRSGSGKSSLLNVAAGLMRPSTGAIRWRDADPFAIGDDARARERRRFIGYVFQSGGLVPTLTAAENTALPGIPDGVAFDEGARAIELLDRVGLAADRARHFPAQLSGGEQRRVGIARALFADPEVLIIDEPTSNLDRKTADDVLALIVGLRDRSRAILVASHDDHLIRLSDDVLYLD